MRYWYTHTGFHNIKMLMEWKQGQNYNITEMPQPYMFALLYHHDHDLDL